MEHNERLFMRIQPVFSKINNNRISKAQTQFESKSNSAKEYRPSHIYTGVASVDLAYASMFDSSIAKDLKLMGLI